MTQPPANGPAETGGTGRGPDGPAGPSPVAGSPGAGSSAGPVDSSGSDTGRRPGRPRRQAMLLRLDPAVHEALTTWAADELRSVNAQVELLLRRALAQAGRAPKNARPIPRRGRPRANPPPPTRCE